jgi:hypothetical protein
MGRQDEDLVYESGLLGESRSREERLTPLRGLKILVLALTSVRFEERIALTDALTALKILGESGSL